ncbi:MAG TPA: dipeptidase [Parvularculaceae bacterium]|nr:dipeptidase [Parvularculaceae bacterium]
MARVVTAAAILLAMAAMLSVGAADAKSKRSMDVVEAALRRTPLIDGHNDLFIQYMDCAACPRGPDAYDIGGAVEGDTDIPRWREGRVGAQLLNVFGPGNATRDTLEAFDFLYRLAARYPADIEIAASANDVRRIWKSGRIAIVPTLEGATRLENSTAMLRTLHRLGLRAVTLAYDTNDLADGSDDTPRHGGLSPLGADMVREMNRIGVLIDLSHVSTDTMNDVLDIATAPVIFSHSSSRALVDVERNVPDEVLARLRANGGLVMVSFVPYFSSTAYAEWMAEMEDLSDSITADVGAGKMSEAEADKAWDQWQASHPAPEATIADVADHIEHVRSVAGVDHVGLGSDFDGISSHKVKGLEDVSTFPALLKELAARGWTEDELAKLSGENFLRVLKAAERNTAGAEQP